MKSKHHEVGMKILQVINRHPPIPSGLQWCLKTLYAHLDEPYGDLLSAMAWLKRIGAVVEEKGEIALTDFGRKIVA